MADDCYIVGDTFEQEDWFKVFFVQPPNGEDLHARNLIEYTWGVVSPPPEGSVSLYEYKDNNREAHFLYTKSMEVDDEETEEYLINVKARDLRFSSLDISDTEEALVIVDLPCVTEGNSPDFSINDVEMYEPSTGSANLIFTISASEAVSGAPISIDYCTEDATAVSVLPDRDYTETCGTLIFDIGESTKTISVPIFSDDLDEEVEFFKMNLSNAARGTLSKPTGIGTIDLVPTIITELVAEDASVMKAAVILDTSGSTHIYNEGNYENPEVYTNNVLSTRRYLMEQIIMDYDLLTVNPELLEGLEISDFSERDPTDLEGHSQHLSGGLSTIYFDKDDVEFIAPNGGSLKQVADSIDTYITGKTFTEDDVVNIVVLTDAADGNGGYDPQTVWQNELANFPQTMQKVNLSIIRVCKASFETKSNYLAAEEMFKDFIIEFEKLNPSKFNGIFETFNTYTTGGDSQINQILNESFASEYSSYCNVHGPETAISIRAENEEEAQSKAEEQITCP